MGLFHAFKKDDIYWKWKAAGGAHGAMVSLTGTTCRGIKRPAGRRPRIKRLTLKTPGSFEALSEFGDKLPHWGICTSKIRTADQAE